MQDVLSWRPLWFYSDFVTGAFENAVEDDTGIVGRAAFAWRHTVEDKRRAYTPPAEERGLA